MGIIRGYICASCHFEKTYQLGIGFSNQKERFLFECDKCYTIKQSALSNPKCSKCKTKSLKKITDFNKKLECPKCKERKFNYEITGMWD